MVRDGVKAWCISSAVLNCLGILNQANAPCQQAWLASCSPSEGFHACAPPAGAEHPHQHQQLPLPDLQAQQAAAAAIAAQAQAAAARFGNAAAAYPAALAYAPAPGNYGYVWNLPQVGPSRVYASSLWVIMFQQHFCCTLLVPQPS